MLNSLSAGSKAIAASALKAAALAPVMASGKAQGVVAAVLDGAPGHRSAELAAVAPRWCRCRRTRPNSIRPSVCSARCGP